jgi:protein O-mannosyl-transferase
MQAGNTENPSMNWMIPLFLAGTVFLVYINSWQGIFQWDDYNVIVQDSTVHSLSAWFKDLRFGIRPVLKLTYSLNWVSGAGLFGFHLLNISIHAINSILVYILVSKFLERYSVSTLLFSWTNPALLAGLLFAIHPVQTEAVTYISGRSTSLVTLYYLCSLLAYIHGAQTKKGLLLYMVSPLLFVIAAATKEVALTLPASLLLWEVSVNQQRWTEILRRQAIHWLILIGLALVIAAHPNYRSLVAFGFTERNLHDNLLSQINGVSYLISRFIWIHRLNIDPDLPVISRWNSLLIAQIVFLLSVVSLGLLTLRRRPWIGFGLLWFFLQLIPTNSVIPRLDIANERQLYLAGIGIFLAVSMEIQGLQSYTVLPQRFFQTVVVMLLLLFGTFTMIRNNDYRSEIALWKNAARNSPQKARVFNNLGNAYELAGCPEEAFLAYSRALQLSPHYDLARKNLRYLQIGRELGEFTPESNNSVACQWINEEELSY